MKQFGVCRSPGYALALCLLLTAAALCAWAEEARPLRVIGVMRASSFGRDDPALRPLSSALRELGYVEGRDYKLEQLSARNQADRLPVLAQGLVRRRVNVIVATTTVAAQAAKEATATIPIVMVAYDRDPVGRRPGADAGAAGWQRHRRVCAPAGAHRQASRAAQGAASRPGQGRGPARRLDSAIPRGARRGSACCEGCGSIASRCAGPMSSMPRSDPLGRGKPRWCCCSPMFQAQRTRIAAAAAKSGMPTMSQELGFVQAGGLMSFAPDRLAVLARVAYLIGRLFDGAKPSKLPVEQASKIQYWLSISRRRASLGSPCRNRSCCAPTGNQVGAGRQAAAPGAYARVGKLLLRPER